MGAERDRDTSQKTAKAGFAILDDKGRISLPKPLRHAFGLGAGSSVAYVALGDMILLVPQDAHMAALTERASRALEGSGITVDDFLTNLPRARADVVADAYGDGFLEDLERRHGAPDTAESNAAAHGLDG